MFITVTRLLFTALLSSFVILLLKLLINALVLLESTVRGQSIQNA